MSRESAGERGRSLLRPMISTLIRVSSLRPASPIRWKIRLEREGGVIKVGKLGFAKLKQEDIFRTSHSRDYIYTRETHYRG